MAIPTTLFTASHGVALMRYNHTGAEWFFVRWVVPGLDITHDDPGPGTYTYALWLVVGAGSGADSSGGLATGEMCAITLIEVKR